MAFSQHFFNIHTKVEFKWDTFRKEELIYISHNWGC